MDRKWRHLFKTSLTVTPAAALLFLLWVRKQVVNAFLLDTSVEVSAATLTGGA